MPATLNGQHVEAALESLPNPPQVTPTINAKEPILPSVNGNAALSSHSKPTGTANDPSRSARPAENVKPWVVQKFGGTSVGKFPLHIVDGVVLPSLKTSRVAVVCSARSSSTKSEGTTNRLLRAAKEAEVPFSTGYESIIRDIEEDHVASARQYIDNKEVAAALVKEIQYECNELVFFLKATQRVGEISTKSLDTIISKGENLSCRYVAALLRDRGVNAKFMDLSNIIPPKSSKTVDQSFYANFAMAVAREIHNSGDVVPVLTGYFGVVPGGILNQIGRGYTDLCAAIVAIGLKASELQIWKEVDGIFTADPRKVPTARLLSTISPAEAAELTFYGSEVIHPFTMEQVIRAEIPIRIKNVMNPRGSGTIIVPDPSGSRPSTPVGAHPLFKRARSSMNIVALDKPKRPTAVTIKHNILILNVHSNKRSLSPHFFARIFSTLDKWRLSVDLISTSEVHVSMALHSESELVAGDEDNMKIVDADLKGAVEDLKQVGTVDISDGLAILSLVGKQMKNMPGIAGKMFTVLGENEVNIEMISQGASEINISCVIDAKDANRAINILHTSLFTFFGD